MNSDRINQPQERYDTPLLKFCVFSYPDEVFTPSLVFYTGFSQDPSYRTTTGQLTFIKYLPVDDTFIKLLLLDVSTQPHFFGILRSLHFVGSSAAVFVFSKSDNKFLASTQDLFHRLKLNTSDPPLPIAFIGLSNDSEVVSTSAGEELAHDLGGAYYEMLPHDLPTLETILQSLTRKRLERYFDD